MSKQRKKSIKEHEQDYDFKPKFDRYDKPKPITENHRKYHNLLKDSSKKIVICNGYAGTSKSISSMYYACQSVLSG